MLEKYRNSHFSTVFLWARMVRPAIPVLASTIGLIPEQNTEFGVI
jgi:hypothetical protein